MPSLRTVITFLSVLSKNNNRKWFHENRPLYIEAKEIFDHFVEELWQTLITVEPKLDGLDPKKISFRIYRDVRFSKDKRPYKINMGAVFSPNGKTAQEPKFYVHIEPGKSFAAGGVYQPDKTYLNAIRQEIDYNFEKLDSILNNTTFKCWYPGLSNVDKLKTTPRGYSKDHPQIDLLRHKSFVVSHPFSDREVTDKKFLNNLKEAFLALKPLHDFLAKVMM